MGALYKNILWAILTLAVLAVFFSSMFGVGPESQLKLTVGELAGKIENGEVKRIVVEGNQLTIELADGTKTVARKEADAAFTETLKNYGVSPEALREVAIEIKDESGFEFWVGILLPTLLPLIVIVAVFSVIHAMMP